MKPLSLEDASHGLEWRERYEIIKGICEGLVHLHEKHILHLDLKPGIILVDDHMVPKIVDFGLFYFEHMWITVSWSLESSFCVWYKCIFV